MVKFQFKGLICPVFTPFTQDKRTIDYDVIEKYGQYLKTKGIHGVLVNGTVGEGTCLRFEEHKRLAEEWLKVCRKHGLTMLLTIGGVGVTEVYDLVEHAEKIGVDCITLLPDLFYKPRTEEDLVDYIKDVVKHCPTRPIYYHHIPTYTSVRLNLLRLYELLHSAIPNFDGIYYRHTNIEAATNLLKEGHNIILSTDTILVGVLTLGFETISSISLNLYPEHVTEIYEYVLNGKWREARETNDKLFHRIKGVVAQQTFDWVELLKREFNKMADFKVGETRKPTITWNPWNRT
ncbi:N-acetylneuraminate lyase B-like [Contarinia nasturtii]|uniref:N-acetylneuraminate lyase B-like n=1 Tax=Contarinia nasturtii TaxID=265458 RepID=UPI0012D381B7|nr:N-acetylneuraminate lyase B-like [Contarinia nasturtii]